MKLKKNKIQLFFLAIFSFLAVTGTSAVKLIVEDYITLPGGTFRVLTLLALSGFFIFTKNKRLGTPEQFFLWFSFFYLIRLYIEIVSGAHYYMSPVTVFFHFLAGALVPVLMIWQIKLRDIHFNLFAKAFILGGILFGIAAYFQYGNYIGDVVRLTTKTTGEEGLTTSLSLGYVSAMTIVVGVSYYYGQKLTLKNGIILLIIIGTSAIPFFLGATRGAAISIIFPFIIILLSKKGIGSKIKLLVTIGALLYLGLVLSAYLGDGFINRFFDLKERIASGGNANPRILLWKQALSQFSAHPVFGDGLKVIGYNRYPHNLFIETLLTTGVIGFIPLVLLIIKAFIKAINIFRNVPEYIWIGVLFLACFIQSMLSFSIYSNPWLWISIALLFAVNMKDARNRNKLSTNNSF